MQSSTFYIQRNTSSNVVQKLAQLTASAKHIAVITLQNIRYGSNLIRSRINIENTKTLKQSGFSVGTRFSINYEMGMVELVKSDHGTNLISTKNFSKRDGSQVIGERLDLRSMQIHAKFAGKEKVLALFLDDRIVFLHLPTITRCFDRAQKLKDAVERGVLRTAALYAGVGTLDVGLHEGFAKSGIHTDLAFVNDSWDVATECLLNDNPVASKSTQSFCGGIEEFIASGMKVSGIDMATIGIPCKGASKLNIANRDLPELHPFAGHQVLNTVMALQLLDFPPLVLVENVRAWADTVSFSMLTRVLHEQGYQTMLVGDFDDESNYKGINSNDYGSIERRVRMALLAYPQGMSLSFEGMIKSGVSTKTVGDIRMREDLVDQSEYLKGQHLNSDHKRDKGWKNRIVSDSDYITPSLSAECWKQRVEDPKFIHPTDPSKCRLPLPEEHAALKGHDISLVNSLVANTHAHTALGNGTAKECWVEFSRTLGCELKKACKSLDSFVDQIRKEICEVVVVCDQGDLFV